jgi:hypothetical protein
MTKNAQVIATPRVQVLDNDNFAALNRRYPVCNDHQRTASALGILSCDMKIDGASLKGYRMTELFRASRLVATAKIESPRVNSRKFMSLRDCTTGRGRKSGSRSLFAADSR